MPAGLQRDPGEGFCLHTLAHRPVHIEEAGHLLLHLGERLLLHSRMIGSLVRDSVLGDAGLQTVGGSSLLGAVVGLLGTDEGWLSVQVVSRSSLHFERVLLQSAGIFVVQSQVVGVAKSLHSHLVGRSVRVLDVQFERLPHVALALVGAVLCHIPAVSVAKRQFFGFLIVGTVVFSSSSTLEGPIGKPNFVVDNVEGHAVVLLWLDLVHLLEALLSLRGFLASSILQALLSAALPLLEVLVAARLVVEVVLFVLVVLLLRLLLELADVQMILSLAVLFLHLAELLLAPPHNGVLSPALHLNPQRLHKASDSFNTIATDYLDAHDFHAAALPIFVEPKCYGGSGEGADLLLFRGSDNANLHLRNRAVDIEHEVAQLRVNGCRQCLQFVVAG